MQILRTIPETQAQSRQWRRDGLSIALVPTMGFLHEGHLSLIRRARAAADRVIVSIFVNPTQFAPDEDFEAYPRDLKRDEALCRQEGADAVFYPGADELYPDDFSTWVEETALSHGLCGASRPGHFRGVATIVAKLFNACLPDLAVFGQKDAQQALIIQRMVRDLHFPVEIDVAPIVREPDGLAMSSRNTYLSPEERERALSLSQGLAAAQNAYEKGEREAIQLRELVGKQLRDADAEIDYVELVSRQTLQPLTYVDQPALLAVAVRIGKTRLIDNCFLGAEPETTT